MDPMWKPRRLEAIPTKRLRAAGLRPTIIRCYLFDIFEQCRHQSLTGEETYRVLIKAGVSATLSSVYCNLRHLTRVGLLVNAEPREKIRTCATFRFAEMDSI